MLLIAVIFFVPQELFALRFDQETAKRDYRAGIGLLKEKDYELARTQFRDFLESYPESPARGRVFVGLAETYYFQEQYDTASRIYLKALSTTTPDTKTTRWASDGIWKSVRKSSHPEKFLDRLSRVDTPAINRLPDTTFDRLFRMISTKGDSEAALEFAKNQLDRNPGSGRWKYRVALGYARQQQYGKALELLDNLGEPWTQLRYDATLKKADILFEQGKLKMAEYRYQFLLRNDTHQQKARYGLAWIMIERNKLREARDHLALVTHVDGRIRSEAARDLARIYRELGNTKLAAPWYEKAIKWSEGTFKSKLKKEFNEMSQTSNS